MQQALVTFDLDGTLLDTAPGTVLTVNRTLASLGLPALSPPAIRGFIGHGVQALLRQVLAAALPGKRGTSGTHGTGPAAGTTANAGTTPLAEHHLEERLADATPVFFHHYEAVLAAPGPLYPGVAEGLARLRDAGVHTAVVSNKEWRLVRRILRSAGLLDHFDLVVGGDTLPERKPHPGQILHCLHKLAVTAGQAAHVGDMQVDVEAARRAGVAAWVVPYGYQSPEALLASNPDRVFASIAALADHVLSAADRVTPAADRAGHAPHGQPPPPIHHPNFQPIGVTES